MNLNKKFKCNFCSYSTDYKHHLKVHIKRHNEGFAPPNPNDRTIGHQYLLNGTLRIWRI